MASSITVRTSHSVDILLSRVAEIVKATRDDSLFYDSVDLCDLPPEGIAAKLTEAFNRLVKLTSPDPSLHILAVVPLYEEDSQNQLRSLLDACSSLKISFTLHIVALASGLESLFVAKPDTAKSEQYAHTALAMLRNAQEGLPFALSFSIIDNYAANGAPMGFSIDTLARYIALFQNVLAANHFDILSPALLSGHRGKNLSVGIASLSFDRGQAARQLLGRAFLAALADAGIKDSTVDAQMAANKADKILADISERYPKMFDKEIRPLYRDRDVSENDIVAAAPQILDKEIEGIKEKILSVFSDESLSFPDKEAILALILGQDNHLLRGMRYENDGTLLDDACNVPLNLYIEAFNKSLTCEGMLPIRGNFPALKKKVWDEKKLKYVDSEENSQAFNPLQDLKTQKQDIINITSFIRGRMDELADLERLARQSADVDTIRKVWNRPSGGLKDVEYKEQPLDDKYSPSPSLKRKSTVDLRKFFSTVKNQEHLGSCTSFAAVAMYEAMMKLNGIEDNDMSEAFLFYHSNIATGRPNGGSNFFEQLNVLGKNGVCHESFFPYDAENPSTPPSQEAIDDAANHRVIAAKQIPLVNEPDKALTLKHNHSMLTAALSEGYPVGISLKIYDNLGKNGPFVLHPADTPEANEDGWHAMVIVGFSEDNDFYIVRNSWGPQFGDNGYCYIPSAYIDDPDYMNFGCIITEISDSAQSQPSEIPTVLADFSATETEIRMATIRNVVAKQRVELASARRLYEDYYKYYQTLVYQLAIPKVQTAIRQSAQANQALRHAEADDKMKALEAAYVDSLNAYKKQLRKVLFYLSAASLALAVATYASRNTIVGIIFLVLAAITVIAFLGYKWSVKNKRRELREQIADANSGCKRELEKLLETKIRFHIAGMWITRFHTLSADINSVYNRLAAYNASLREWRKNYEEHLSDFSTPEGEMFRSLNPSEMLIPFFNENRDAIVEKIDLLKMFDQYNVNPEKMDEYHLGLQNKVTEVIDSLMNDFNIANFLMGDSCRFLAPVDLQEEISTLLSVGLPAYRNPAMNASAPIRFISANIDQGRHAQWDALVNPYFPMRPVHLPSADSNSLHIITIHPI